MKQRSARFIVYLSLCVVLTLSLLLILLLAQQEKKSDVRTWSEGGNYIVSYGPLVEPYSDSIKSNYYLYSPDGKRLAHEGGPGTWSSTALPTEGKVFLSFSGFMKQAGDNTNKVSIGKYSTPDFFDRSPNGQFSVILFNTSNFSEFEYTLLISNRDGSIEKRFFPAVPHTLAVGDTESIITAYSQEGDTKSTLLNMLDKSGDVTPLRFPDDPLIETHFNPETDFRYPDVTYLGDGRYELLQGRTGRRQGATELRLTSFEVSINRDQGRLEILNTRPIYNVLFDDFSVTRMLPRGENGVITKSGKVYVNHRDTSEPEYMGSIMNYSDGQFIYMEPNSSDPKFGLRRNNRIEVRRWNDPEKIVFCTDRESFACLSSNCDVTHITETLGR